jgi:hypothetical protein
VGVRLKQVAPSSSEAVVAIADDKPGDMKLSENEMVDVPQDQPAVAEYETSKSPALSQTKAFARPVKSLHEVKTEPEPEPEVVTTVQAQPTLREQWEERRLRRAMRRERRDERNARRNRDLFRIDELFEGQRPR